MEDIERATNDQKEHLFTETCMGILSNASVSGTSHIPCLFQASALVLRLFSSLNVTTLCYLYQHVGIFMQILVQRFVNNIVGLLTNRTNNHTTNCLRFCSLVLLILTTYIRAVPL